MDARLECAAWRGRAGRLLRARPLQPAQVDRRSAWLPRQGRSASRAAGAFSLQLLRSFRRRPAALRPGHGRRRSRAVRRRSRRDGHTSEEEFFSAEQNARLIANAERYYRAMFHGRANSWNLRDEHMFETLNQLVRHLDSGRARVVVWAHNSHLGDARATAMHRRGELNVGQLARERFGGDSFAIGFTTYSGTVTAASDWGEPAERKQVR